MSTKSHKLFVVKDIIHPDAAPRLIKGKSRSQVAQFLAASVSIEAGDGLEAAQILKDYPDVTLEDATVVGKDDAISDEQSLSRTENDATSPHPPTDAAANPLPSVTSKSDGDLST